MEITSTSTVLGDLAATVSALLRDDEHRVLLGEDVADGGMWGLSGDAIKHSGLRGRIVSTPLVPTVMAAHAAGLAAAGRPPIVLLPGIEALIEGLAGLREAALWSWRTEQTRTVPVCFIAPSGPGLGLGPCMADTAIATLTQVPGLTILCAADPCEASAWLRAAVEYAAQEGPTVLVLPRSLLLRSPAGPMATHLGRRPTAAHRVREGQRVTVFSWSETLPVVVEAVERVQVDAAVVDVGCLAPLDLPTLEAEARATGRLVIAHAGSAVGGVGAELAARFADSAILHLDAPVVRVTGAPSIQRLSDEATAIPGIDQIAEAISLVARY